MSRRATSSAGSVSLFPFLAVLVCAMGALILLLLVTTRRLRQRALTEETVVQPIEIEKPAATNPNETSSAPPPLLAEIDTDPADEPILPLLAIDPPPPLPAPYDPTPELLARLSALEAEQAALAADIAQKQQKIAQLEAAKDGDAQVLANLEGEATSLAAEQERLNNLHVRLRLEEVAAKERADELRTKIQRARSQLADADSKFAVVPYDGHSGTTRRPIIIECTAEGFLFASEGVFLKATDLNGFTPRYNPLLYATKALIRYWERRDRTSVGEEIGEPYLLLVVRPEGTTGYYVARGFLAGMREPFGYELVTADQAFAWPPSDPEAANICRTLIDQMLSDRDELMEVALHNGAHLSKFSDSNGHFRLEEIERLKNPTREVTINGQRFSRSSSGFGGESGSFREPYGTRSGQAGDRSAAGTGTEPSRLGGMNHGPGHEPSRPNGRGGEVPQGTYTRQESAITRADRMPEWLRNGNVLHPPPPRRIGFADGAMTDGHTQPNDRSGQLLNPTQRSTAESITPGERSPAFDEFAASVGQPGSGQPGSSQPVEGQPPSLPGKLTYSRNRDQEERPIDSRRPQWGIRSGSGTIGFERDVRVRISTTQVSIGDGDAYQIDPRQTITNIQRLLAASINREVRGWGSPPKSFYWVPAIRFVVTPGGRAHHGRLSKIARAWDLRTTVEYASEE